MPRLVNFFKKAPDFLEKAAIFNSSEVRTDTVISGNGGIYYEKFISVDNRKF